MWPVVPGHTRNFDVDSQQHSCEICHLNNLVDVSMENNFDVGTKTTKRCFVLMEYFFVSILILSSIFQAITWDSGRIGALISIDSGLLVDIIIRNIRTNIPFLIRKKAIFSQVPFEIEKIEKYWIFKWASWIWQNAFGVCLHCEKEAHWSKCQTCDSQQMIFFFCSVAAAAAEHDKPQ